MIQWQSRSTTRAITLAFLFVLAIAGCRTTTEIDARSIAGCNAPHFPYHSGWLGGDSAYSIPLADGRSLWLFGDTFVGREGQRDRIGSKLIHNSIGISRCTREGRFEVAYHWERGREPRAFIPHPSGDRFYWLFDGFTYEGSLYLALLEVSLGEARGPLNLPFRFEGTQLARVARPQDEPARWQPERIPFTRSKLAFPGAFAIEGRHLYFFSFFDRDGASHPRFLARLPLDALAMDAAALPDAVETFTSGGSWLPGFHPERARILMDDTATEMSVHRDASDGSWVAIYSHPNATGGFPDDPRASAIWMRYADRLVGPWSEPRVVARATELRPARDPATICYAAKAHEQYATNGTLPITYACNLYTPNGEDPYAVLRRLLGRMDLYRPTSLLLDLPASGD